MFIINYHNVLGGTLDSFDLRLPRISQINFENQIKFLSSNFDLVNVKSIVDNIGKERQRNRTKIAITFDDGCLGVLKYAIPILEKYKAPATLYVVTEFVNNSNNFKYYDCIEVAFRLTKKKKMDLSFIGLGVASLKNEDTKIKCMKYVKRTLKVQESEERRKNTKLILEMLSVSQDEMNDYILNKEKYAFLSWEEIRHIKNMGYDIGSHTKTHPTLSKISLECAFEELTESYNLIKGKLNINELSFAYPHGNMQHIGDKIPNIVKEVGYSFALTTIPDAINEKTDKFMVNRMTFEEFYALL